LLDTFLDLVRIDSPSGSEGAVAAYCADALREAGCEVTFDDAGERIGSDTGNLIAVLPGTAPGCIVLTAHMDCVQPCCGIEPIITDGLIHTDGTTVLGGDDKVGDASIIEAVRALTEGDEPYCTVKIILTVQEEVGCRGVEAAAFAIDPQIGIALDVGFATDLPDIPKKQLGDVTLGAGPILTRSCDNNIPLGKLMRKAADAKKIPYQESAAHRATGGTDTAKLQMTRGGVATALISIPNRYMHSQVEMCDLRDAEGAVKILTETIAALKGNENFIPGEDQ
jgi:putative aminopeptidase FrvX